jgi:hypothetical protein
MARIYTFETRDARMERLAKDEPQTEVPLTNEERHRIYDEHTLMVCRDLVNYYKKTNRWSDACEPHMVTVVRSLKTICRMLASASETPQ